MFRDLESERKAENEHCGKTRETMGAVAAAESRTAQKLTPAWPFGIFQPKKKKGSGGKVAKRSLQPLLQQ